MQGDEPFLDPRLVGRLITALHTDRKADMATAACPLEPSELDDPNCVKVVTSLEGNALYFSRSPVPADRDGDAHPPRFRHLGLYAYRRKFLLDFVKWKQTPLEKSEKLEQLRALEHGATIRVLTTRATGPGVDTPEDAALAEKVLAARVSKK